MNSKRHFTLPMPTNASAVLAAAGRLLMAGVFVPAGFAKVFSAAATADLIATGGLPHSVALATAVGGFEVLAGALLLIGYQARWAALALAAYTTVASVLYHGFWAAAPAERFITQLLFLKNMGLVGGLLMVAALGAGPCSADDVKTRRAAFELG